MKEQVKIWGKLDTGDWDEMHSFENWTDAGAAVDSLRDGTFYAAEGVTIPSTQEYMIGTEQPKKS